MLLVLSLALAAPVGALGPAEAEVLIQALERGDLPCSTPVVASLGHAWATLSPAQRARVDAILRPSGGTLVGAALRPQAPAPPARDSCWSNHDNRVVGEHFVVEYEDGVSVADANTFLADLEYSWSVEVDELGWRPPNGSDDYLILAEIKNERTSGAYTWFERCDGIDIPYFSTGEDSWDDPDWGATMAAHEFNHAIQMGYGWSNEFWWWEATATWVEDYVYPDTEYWSYYVQGYTSNPHIALAASNQQDQDIFWHMYGMSILAFHLDDHFGGHDTVLGTWQDAEGVSGMYSRSAEDMAEDQGLDWLEVYADFAARNAFMDYTQQRWFPDVDLEDSVDELPAAGASSNRTEPEGYGQNYIWIEKGIGDGTLVLEFEGAAAVDWSVQLVEGKTSVERVERTVSVDGLATLRLEDYGARDVVLVVSPLTTNDSGRDYAWSLSLEAEAADTGDTGDTGTADDSGIADGDPDDGDGAIDLSEPGGCGCGHTGGGAAGALAALAVGLATRRRR